MCHFTARCIPSECGGGKEEQKLAVVWQEHGRVNERKMRWPFVPLQCLWCSSELQEREEKEVSQGVSKKS